MRLVGGVNTPASERISGGPGPGHPCALAPRDSDTDAAHGMQKEVGALRQAAQSVENWQPGLHALLLRANYQIHF